MAQSVEQKDAAEALLCQTICCDLSLSPDFALIWAGLYERIAGPCVGDMSAEHRCISGTEAEEVGLSRTA